MRKIIITMGTSLLICTLLFTGVFSADTEDINDLDTVEETEEEVEEEVEELEGQESRLGRMKEVISSLIDGLEEDAPQREALLMVLGKAENIGERVTARLEEARQRMEQARERRELAGQHQRLTRMRATIEGLMDNAEEGAKSALQAVWERAETVQNRIRERFNQ